MIFPRSRSLLATVLSLFVGITQMSLAKHRGEEMSPPQCVSYADLGESVRAAVEESANTSVTLNAVGPTLVWREGKVTPAVGIYTELEKPKGRVYVLLYTTITVREAIGGVTFDANTVVADLRQKDPRIRVGPFSIGPAESLGQNIMRHFAGRISDAVKQPIANDVTGLPAKHILFERDLLCFELGVVSDGLTIDRNFRYDDILIEDNIVASDGYDLPAIAKWHPKLGTLRTKKQVREAYEQSAVVLTLFYNHLKLHTLASVHNGDPRKFGNDDLCGWFREDADHPGLNRLMLFLPEGWEAENLDDGPAFVENHWDDMIASVIIHAGGQYRGQELIFSQGPLRADERSIRLGIGSYSMNVDGREDGYYESISGIQVVN